MKKNKGKLMKDNWEIDDEIALKIDSVIENNKDDKNLQLFLLDKKVNFMEPVIISLICRSNK